MILYLDCDTGIDDAIAIAYLLTRPDVTLAGIGTVNGNTTAGQAAANTLGLLSLAGRDDIPVAAGPDWTRESKGDVHGDNGVGGYALPSGAEPIDRTPVELLLDLSQKHPGELHILATGPCTNLAAALSADPTLPGRIASVTVMGGAVRIPGNITPTAEANIYHDPAAAAAVFAAAWPVTLVPLDVTLKNRWSEADVERLREAGTPLATALAGMVPTYFAWYSTKFEKPEIPLHDPLAAGVAIGELTPSDAPMLSLTVSGDGRIDETAGASNPVRVVLDLESPAGPLVLNRILAG